MSMIPQVQHYGHDYWIVPSELLEGVSTTEPPDGMSDGWSECDDLAEIDPDLAAKLAAERGPDWRPDYPPIHSPPGYFVIVEYVSNFDVWSILMDTLFHDADDARGWLLEEIGPPDPGFTDYIGDTVVLDKDMPLKLRAYRSTTR
jgi:hypothetical protein